MIQLTQPDFNLKKQKYFEDFYLEPIVNIKTCNYQTQSDSMETL